MVRNGEKPEGWVDFDKAKAVPFDVVLEGLGLSRLRREGDKLKGICPFHGGEKESFAVNIADGWFKCYGCKKQGGNVLEFVRVCKQVSPKEAAQWLVDLGERSEREGRTPAGAGSDELTVREQAICRAVARYLAAVFAPLGNVDKIEEELTALVREETGKRYT